MSNQGVQFPPRAFRAQSRAGKPLGPNGPFTSGHIQSGRVLLGWTQARLARTAGISPGTVKRAESGLGVPPIRSRTALKLREVLEAAGIEFLAHWHKVRPRERASTKMPPLDAAQCRAARALLNWTLGDLSTASGVNANTISQFEIGKVAIRRSSHIELIEALDQAGVQFIDDARGGPGVRLRDPKGGSS